MTKKMNAAFRDQLMREGVPKAYSALVRVLDDPKASSTALASAARTVLDIAGMTKPSDDSAQKEPHEMTAGELAERIRQIRSAQRDDDGVFD